MSTDFDKLCCIFIWLSISATPLILLFGFNKLAASSTGPIKALSNSTILLWGVVASNKFSINSFSETGVSFRRFFCWKSIIFLKRGSLASLYFCIISRDSVLTAPKLSSPVLNKLKNFFPPLPIEDKPSVAFCKNLLTLFSAHSDLPSIKGFLIFLIPFPAPIKPKLNSAPSVPNFNLFFNLR